MSEQKYYVFLSPLDNGKKPFYQLIKHGFMGELVGFAKCKTKNKDGRYENKYSKFTKTELAEIMDGSLYKQTHAFPFSGYYGSDESLSQQYNWSYNFEIKRWEWKNPLIELVPVEEEE